MYFYLKTIPDSNFLCPFSCQCQESVLWVLCYAQTSTYTKLRVIWIVSNCIFFSYYMQLWKMPFWFLQMCRATNWDTKRSKKRQSALWGDGSMLSKNPLHSLHRRGSLTCLLTCPSSYQALLPSTAVAFSVSGLGTTHKPSSPLETVAFCFGDRGQGLGEVSLWHLKGVTHESGHFGWWVRLWHRWCRAQGTEGPRTGPPVARGWGWSYRCVWVKTSLGKGIQA